MASSTPTRAKFSREEPDAGNPHVRVFRGGDGNIPTYSAVGRFDFESRNTLFDQMALHQPEDYAHYLHDHAAVAFQLGKIERSEQLFGSLRASRIQDPNIWIWHNERIFVLQDGDEIKL